MANLGGCLVREGQVCWRGKHALAFFPQKQLMPGHVVLTNLGLAYQYSEWSLEEVKETAHMIFVLNNCLRQYFSAPSATVHFQVVEPTFWKKTLVHIIPRKQGDLTENDQIYKMIDSFPIQLLSINADSSQDESSFEDCYLKAQKLRQFMSKII